MRRIDRFASAVPRTRIPPPMANVKAVESTEHRIKRMSADLADLRSRLSRVNRGADPEVYARMVRLLVEREKGLNFITRKHGNGNQQ